MISMRCAAIVILALAGVARADAVSELPVAGEDEALYSCKTRTGTVAVTLKPETELKDHHGIATLTRGPVTSTTYLALPGRPRWISEPRCALVTRLPGGLVVVNTHLSVVPADRLSQASVLTSVLDVPELIVLGDLNCTTRSAPFRILSQNLRAATTTVRSWPTRFPVFQLDHILVRGALTVIKAGVWSEGEARRASDHLPVFAELG